jgi:YjbE family integral membrane protein
MNPAQPDLLSALLAIILIDLVLAGDNAIIIGIAARNVPKNKQRAVILWGTAGAIAVRVLLTGAVVWLLKIPGFLLAGGAALTWIGWKLTAPQDSSPEKIAAGATLGAAVRTIIIADTVMGVDNVLAVGGAAQGNFMLVVIGLVISIPIVVWGSALVLKLVDRFPAILWLGAGVIGWTAAKMIGGEPLLAEWFARAPWLRGALYAIIIGALAGIPLWRSLNRPSRVQVAALLATIVWIGAFGWIEDHLGMRFDLLEHEHWDDEWLDLVRWIGWIPLVIAIDRAFGAKAAATR